MNKYLVTLYVATSYQAIVYAEDEDTAMEIAENTDIDDLYLSYSSLDFSECEEYVGEARNKWPVLKQQISEIAQ